MKRYIIPGILAALLTVSLLPAPTYTYVVRELSQTFTAVQAFARGFSVSGPVVDHRGASQMMTDLHGSEASQYNMTYTDYIEFMDDMYDNYFTNRYDNTDGWFEADGTGADGDGFTDDDPFTYINCGFLSYAGLKASQGVLDSTLTTRLNNVIDNIFVSPVFSAGNDLTRTLDCTGSVGAESCTAGSGFSATEMKARSDVFSLECYPGAYLVWLNYANAGIGTTRRATIKTFIDDTVNQSPNGYNQKDLLITPVHLYVKHLAGTSQVSNFTTLVGSGGWGARFDAGTGSFIQGYVSEAFAWLYDQTELLNPSTCVGAGNPNSCCTGSGTGCTANFATLEYSGFLGGAGAYNAMIAEGSTRNTTAEARIRAVGLRLMGNLSHNGWPAGSWFTQYGYGRQDIPGYAIGYVLTGLDAVMANPLIFSDQERRWAKYLYDRALNTYELMDTYNSDADDSVVNPEPYGATAGGGGQDGDKAVGVAHAFRSIAWHLILDNDLLEADEPPNLAWYDWQQNLLTVSTPVYSTSLFADIEGQFAFGSQAFPYDSNSGGENLGSLVYTPTNEKVIDRADEGQVTTLTAAGVAAQFRRLQHGMFIFSSLTSTAVLDELNNPGSITATMLRPLMKTDAFSVRGFGVSGSGYSKRFNLHFEPTWEDGSLIATSTIDRSDDTDAGFDDYKDVVTYRYYTDFIEESHDITTPGGACATCFAYFLLRPPNNGQAYFTQAGRIYDSTATIPVRYEVQRDAAEYQPSTITYTGTPSRNDAANNGCPIQADGCTGAGAPSASCGGVDICATCLSDSAAGVGISNTKIGSVRFGNSTVTVTLTHAIDTDMGVSAAADNRISYQVGGRKYSGSPNFLVTLDGGTQRSKSAAGTDTDQNNCFAGGEAANDWQQIIYNSSSDDASTVMTAGNHTVAVTNTNPANIYLDFFQVTSQSPARFLDNETAGGWIPPASIPGTDNWVCTASGVPYSCCSGAGAGTCYNDWYLELRDSDATSGYIAWFPDKTLITAGLEARYRRMTSDYPQYNNDPPSVVGMKLYGNNYAKALLSEADATVPAFQFSVEYYPYNGDHYEANRIWEDIIKWRPRVRQFVGAATSMTISVNEIGIDLTPGSKVSVAGLGVVGTLGVRLDYANDDLIITRSDATADSKIVWNVEKQ